MTSSKVSNENLDKALRIIQAHKEFKKTFNESPPQTKVFIAFLFPFIAGLPFYSFMSNYPTRQLVIFSIISFIFGWIFYIFTSKYNEKLVVIIAYLVGTFFWFYIFVKNYREKQKAGKTGKKSFVCEPNGICQTDGTSGPYNGLTKYFFNPPSASGEKDDKIPPNQFDIRISNKFTYMFWLKIDYAKWKSSSFYGQDKVILVKGNDYENADLSVWASPVDDIIQFEVGTASNTPVYVSVNFPFDKWVHYAIVVNNKVVELYKNATLEQSAVLTSPISLRRSPLYLGRTPDNQPGRKYNKFPGQLLYLTYNNENLKPGEIYEIYKNEYSILSNMNELSNTIPPSSEKCPDKDVPSVSHITEGDRTNDTHYFNSIFQKKPKSLTFSLFL